MYVMEVWSILHERDMCVALVMELEEALAEESLTDEDEEMVWEKS